MMYRESCVCEILELFLVPPSNGALELSKCIEYQPVCSTLNSDTAPTIFDIRGQDDENLNLSETSYKLSVNLAGDHSASTPINNILHSQFTEIDVSLNGKIITPGKDTYPRKITLLQVQNPKNSNERLYPVGETHDQTH